MRSVEQNKTFAHHDLGRPCYFRNVPGSLLQIRQVGRESLTQAIDLGASTTARGGALHRAAVAVSVKLREPQPTKCSCNCRPRRTHTITHSGIHLRGCVDCNEYNVGLVNRTVHVGAEEQIPVGACFVCLYLYIRCRSCLFWFVCPRVISLLFGTRISRVNSPSAD